MSLFLKWQCDRTLARPRSRTRRRSAGRRTPRRSRTAPRRTRRCRARTERPPSRARTWGDSAVSSCRLYGGAKDVIIKFAARGARTRMRPRADIHTHLNNPNNPNNPNTEVKVLLRS